MFLNELLAKSYLQEESASDDAIVIIPAGVRTGVDYNLLVKREDFEAMLVKFRASEPASEAILMTIGKAKGLHNPVWSVLLQNETVVDHYTKLCNEKYESQLKKLEDAEQTVDASQVQKPGEKTVIAPGKDVSSMAPQGGSRTIISEWQFENVADTGTKNSNAVSSLNGVEEEREEFGAPASGEVINFEAPTSVAEDHANQLPSANDATEEAHLHAVNAAKGVMDDLLNLVSTYGIDNVCSWSHTTFEKLIHSLEGKVDGISEFFSDCAKDGFTPDAVFLSVYVCIQNAVNKCLDARDYDRVNAILEPIMTIIYEE